MKPIGALDWAGCEKCRHDVDSILLGNCGPIKEHGKGILEIDLKNESVNCLRFEAVPCLHPKTHPEEWPDGSGIEVCDICGMSRNHWEQGSSAWIMVKDIPAARQEVQQAINEMISQGNR